MGEGVDHLGRELGDVMERSQPAAGPEHLGRLGRAGDRVHPVPGGAGDDRVELPPGRLPVLEPGDLDLNAAASCEGGHPLVGFDTEHRAADRLELPSLDAGPGPDVEDVPTGACRDDPVHQGLGIRRSGAVVAFGVDAERLGCLPVAVGLGAGLVRLSLR
ncbi:putative methyltransferase type 11 [Streptomyces sp. Tu6071]|nr:putative methyltransferase type 11 [Streptomyces sp. Tu6071]